MRPTKTEIGAKARKYILDGVNAIYHVVRVTLGPQGRNVLIYRSLNRGGRITNDGFTAAEVQEPKNVFVRLAAHIFKESCQKTNQKVGDGTTCTAVIGGKLYNDVYNIFSQQSELKAKVSIGVMTLKKNILETAEKVKEQIKASAKKVKTLQDLERIATISVENEKVGKIVAKIAWENGADGFIEVIEGYKGKIESEIIEGMRFPAKVPAKAFVNEKGRFEMKAQDCPVLITNYAFDNLGEFLESFQNLNKSTSKLIVIAPSFSENVLVNFVKARDNGFFIYPSNVPSLRKEQFQDLAIYCGAKFIDKTEGGTLKNVQPKDLGFLEKFIVTDTEGKEDAMATGGRGDKEQTRIRIEDTGERDKQGRIKHKSVEYKVNPVKERIEHLKGQLEETKQDQFKKLMERRIASMASAQGRVRVGDSTQASSLYLKLKIEDAVYACKSALRGGYVKGGGLCLKEIADKLPEDDILRAALLEPYEQIQASGDIKITDDVIDPMEAIYYAVEHATQVVAQLATVEVITPEWEDPLPGEGEREIAHAIIDFVASQKVHLGQIKASEEEMWKDNRKGLTVDEMVDLDTG